MSEKKDALILVKVQQSLSSSSEKKSVLVYDKARILFFSSEDPGIVLPLVEKLGDKPKKYFKARIENQELKIFDEVKDQTW